MATEHFVSHSHHHHHNNHQHQQQPQRHCHRPTTVPPPLPPRPGPQGPVAGEEPTDLMDLDDLPDMAAPQNRGNGHLHQQHRNGGNGGNGKAITVPQLPHPEETPPSTLPPEMEEATQNWRQYAAAALFHGRKLTGPSRWISQQQPSGEQDDDMELDEEEPGGDIFRGRRTTVTYRFPTGSNSTASATDESSQLQQQRRKAVARKLSMGHQRRSAEDPRYDDVQQYAMSPQGRGSGDRRLSFPQQSLLSANYAILRKSVDRFEVVGAFHRCHSEAYRHFLQSLTCYDLAPQHGLIVMLDAELTIQKAVQILCAHPAPRVAVISNTRDGHWAMFTVTDCLLALQQAHSQMDAQLGSNSLRHFVEQLQNGRRLISVDDQSSVWDLARVFALNRVHRVPVFSAETNELMSILCPRAICQELLKLLASKCSLSPDLNAIPLSDRNIGTWGAQEIASVRESDSCAKAVGLFLDRQVSALPVLSQNGTLLGVLDKNNLLDRLFERIGHHQTPERCFQLMEETSVEQLLPQTRRRTLRVDNSVADAMRLLTEDGLSESLFVVEPSEDGGDDRLCGVLSHTDILAFILSCEQQQSSM